MEAGAPSVAAAGASVADVGASVDVGAPSVDVAGGAPSAPVATGGGDADAVGSGTVALAVSAGADTGEGRGLVPRTRPWILERGAPDSFRPGVPSLHEGSLRALRCESWEERFKQTHSFQCWCVCNLTC